MWEMKDRIVAAAMMLSVLCVTENKAAAYI